MNITFRIKNEENQMQLKTTHQILKIVLVLIAAFILQSTNSLKAQVHGETSAHTSYNRISMTGYQGWFGTPTDGITGNWRHYKGNGAFKPGAASIEYWPDMREADDDEKYITEFVYENGEPAYVFSSAHPKTISRHFQWMKEYGIDGAFMQRFRSDFGLKATMNRILDNAYDAAKEHGRAICLMYDLSGLNIKTNGIVSASKRTNEVNIMFNDWKDLVNTYELTTSGDDQPYLYHKGKPLVVLWGLGFNSRHDENGYDVQLWIDLVEKFQNDPGYGGCSIMLGVPRNWRTGGGDCISGEEHDKMITLIKKVDIIKPWHTSRYKRSEMKTQFKDILVDDIAWCKANGLEYTATISPGIREKILHGNGYEKSREGGYYFWDMAKVAIDAGIEMLYLGMYDEVDEGTQYHKISNNPPFYSNDLHFATYGNNPEDHYLWLAGEATRAVRGEFVMGDTFRERANNSDFQTEVSFIDSNITYNMQLVHEVAGRKVYFADPYKVPDGAPTIGTIRDSSLFKNVLTSDVVTFEENQRGMYIRLVEVDAATDEIISFKAEIPTSGKSNYIKFKVKTSSTGGAYAPKNIGAMWIENATGNFVKTLKLWADARKDYLYEWLSVSENNTVDAVTSATVSSHKTHEAIWDTRDKNGNRVPTGNYTLKIEINDQDSPGPVANYDFQVGAFPNTLTFPDETNFHDAEIELSHEPTKTFEFNTWSVGNGAIETDPSRASFPENSEVTLTAFAEESWNFLEWSGDFTPTNETTSETITMTEDIEIGALFYPDAHEVNIISPSDDSYTAGGLFNKSRNFNNDPYLVVMEGINVISQLRSYLKFDLTSLNGDVSAAWLKLTVLLDGLKDNEFSPVSVYSIDDDTWSETTITLGTAPADGELLDQRDKIKTLEATYAWDVTDFSNDEKNGDRIASFQIKDPTSSGVAVKFGNREGDYAPVLTVVTDPSTKIDISDATIPQSFKLHQNYPNPFNPTTIITFQLPEASEVNISVYNILGKKIATLINRKMKIGHHTAYWNASNIPTGMYLYKITAGSFVDVKKCILMK